MRKYLSELLKKYTELLEDENADFAALREELLVQIGFMQHERLIHFLVTMLFALVLFICIACLVVGGKIIFLLLTVLVLCLLVPYIAHYFFLENGVQKLYGIYNRYTEKIEEKK